MKDKRSILIGIVIGMVFALGLITAFLTGVWMGRKSDYLLPFLGRRHPPYGFFAPRKFEGHGVIGMIDDISKDTLVVKDRMGVLKTVLVDQETRIRHGFTSLQPSDLKKGEEVIVLGDPEPKEGAITARFIRVL